MAEATQGTIIFIPANLPKKIILISAAVRVKKTGEVFTAKWHFAAMDKAGFVGHKFEDVEEGFQTEDGEFVEYQKAYDDVNVIDRR